MLFSHSPLLRDRAELCCLWAYTYLQGGAYRFYYLSWRTKTTATKAVILNEQSPLNRCKHNPDTYTPQQCPHALLWVFRITSVKSPNLSWGTCLPCRLLGMVLQAYPAWSIQYCWETGMSWDPKQPRGDILSGLLEGVRVGSSQWVSHQ